MVNWLGFKNKKVLKWQDFYFLTKNKLHKRKDFIVCISFDLFSKNNQDLKHKQTYRIDANTTADSIITAPRVNLNTKAPKYLNLNNTTAS